MILNKLSMNYRKTKFMIIANRKRNDKCQTKIGKHTLGLIIIHNSELRRLYGHFHCFLVQ